MKYVCSLLLIIFGFQAAFGQERIKVYAFFTPSHRVLVDEWFLPSLQVLNEFEIILEEWEQSCPSGAFMQQGWMETMHRKVDLIIRAIEENPGKIFIHADVDTQYFAKFADLIEQEMMNCDIAFQRENPQGDLCCGFFACWSNERTLALWRWVKEVMDEKRNDQVCINDNLLGVNAFGVKWKRLPENFFGAATLEHKNWNTNLWQVGASITVPKDPRMHHANYTIGLPNKMAQLKLVRDIINKRDMKKRK